MKLALIISSLLIANFAFANTTNTMAVTPSPSLTTAANLNKGNIQIGGGFYYNESVGISSYSVDPQLEYFVIDSLSVGGKIMTFGQRGGLSPMTGYGIGPSASYYFYKADALAAYVGQAFSFVKYSDSGNTYSRGSTSLGVKYFVVPQVAFGVALTTSYNIAEHESATPATTLGGNFSFYY